MSHEVVIFGGSGFFGMHLCRYLSARPDVGRIVVADLVPPREMRPKVEYVRCDVREPIAVEVFGPPVIYNFAAVHTTPGHADWEYYWTNVRGAIEVCRFADRAGAERINFTSTMGVYGPQEERVDEDTVPRPSTAYGRSKLLAEQTHEDWQKARPGRRLVIIRPAVTFGEGERGNFTRLARLLRRGLFVYPARKDTIKACAPVEQLPACIDFMAQADEPVVRFIYAYPERTTTEAINCAFAQAAGFRPPAIVVPEGMIMATAVVFELINRLGIRTSINRARVRKLIQSTNVYPAELERRGWRFSLSLPEALANWKKASDFQ
ncbi:MAG: NAD(P)-dependent oxidoreductase [Devosia sp.]|uniref:NAD-dependent epimerase/dehydratase family protein n=1 Tax=Devosia sp. TaxID=1871048 RepID=UPI001AD5BFA0|nr:NAD(P)-dependent oxidoreductase [Devosia sp.]MBN9316189.1 NAD(P)-dependent oxidoreductase [Devosia sp.]